jgi:omega-6 fatty acid desaturase (delta-12 desaturase)
MEVTEKELQIKINSVLQKHTKAQNVYLSLSYLLRDAMISILFTCFMYFIKNKCPFFLWYLFYSVGQGTIWTGLWVLAHECGHGAFSSSETINNSVGLILHSFLLVPYYSWQFSHKKHHKYTNHLILGETHVPAKNNHDKKYFQFLGEDAFVLFKLTTHLFFGWPLYLLDNRSGGRTDYAGNRIDKKKSLSHFNPYSQIFPPTMYYRVIVSDLFIGLTLGCLIYLDYIYGFGTSIQWYWGSYAITNCWLVLYTYLQHTSEKIPHYGNSDFTWLKGALSTIDRPYPYLIDEMHHYIGSTHVIHHLNYKIPFHSAKLATKEIKEVLKEKYNYDDSNFMLSLFETMKKCLYVNSLEGTQYYQCDSKKTK